MHWKRVEHLKSSLPPRATARGGNRVFKGRRCPRCPPAVSAPDINYKDYNAYNRHIILLELAIFLKTVKGKHGERKLRQEKVQLQLTLTSFQNTSNYFQLIELFYSCTEKYKLLFFLFPKILGHCEDFAIAHFICFVGL